jgi:hypothetical protein
MEKGRNKGENMKPYYECGENFNSKCKKCCDYDDCKMESFYQYQKAENQRLNDPIEIKKRQEERQEERRKLNTGRMLKIHRN